MKRKLLIASVAFALSLIACTKTNNNEVFIRVENAISESFSNFTFAGTDFGSIAKGDTTMYRKFEKILPHPVANDLTINSNHVDMMWIFFTTRHFSRTESIYCK